ncbi:MAG: hypothetical protein AAFN93_08675 [Bacteroidota bacterium]
MHLFPYNQETVVLPFEAGEALRLIEKVTGPISRVITKNNDFLFNGTFRDNTFTISRKVDYPQNYLPLIKGKVETTRHGSILFLEYELFFSSRMFLSLWTILSIMIAAFLVVFQNEYRYATVSLGAGIINYLVSLMNFKKQVKESRSVLFEALKLT